MKKRIQILLGLAAVVMLPLLAVGAVAQAQTFRSGETTTVNKGEVIDGSLYMAGNSVTVAGEVNGDLYCGGQTVTVTGHVHGDVICAGQSVTVGGQVDGDVRLAGQTVVLDAVVTSNASVFGQTFTLSEKGKVGNDLNGGVQTATVNGEVARDVALAGETVIVNSVVGRNVTTALDSLQLNSSAKVGGDVNYTSKNDLALASGAQVTGKTTRHDPPKEYQDNNDNAFDLGFAIYLVLAMLLIAMLLALVMPRFVHETTTRAVEKPWATLGVGVLAALLGPIVIIATGLTVIGIPLAIFLVLLMLLGMFLSAPLVGYYVGRYLIRGSKRNALSIMLAGATLVLVVFMIPILGGIVWLIACFMGLGMLVRQAFHQLSKPNYDITK